MITILILCTGNSARSIMAEALINHLGENRVKGYSAGSSPAGEVNPFALAMLKSNDLPTKTLRSKSWDEFSTPDAPKINIVITVCDNAAAEPCPLWHGAPIKAHWGIPDPAAQTGTNEEKTAAFLLAYQSLKVKITALLALDLENIEQSELARILPKFANL